MEFLIKRRLNGNFNVYLLGFLLSAHVAIVSFFNANFLNSKGVPEVWLGSLYIAGAFLTMAMYYATPAIIKRTGIYSFLLSLSIFEFILYVAFAFTQSFYFILSMFILMLVTSSALFYGLDIILEASTKNESDTAYNRSSFLTISNIAFVSSPFVAGLILKHYSFTEVYVLSAIIMLPFIYVLKTQFQQTTEKNAKYSSFSLKRIFHVLKYNKNIRSIFIIQFLLQFFFAWMIIYTPIYLNVHIGFSLPAIGIISSVMLIPYIILQYPLGHYADKRYGEKEFLFAGFLLIAISSYALSFINGPDFAIWVTALFITRIGGAIIEVMNEIYFFKKVNDKDVDIIGAYRMLRPISSIIGPATGSIFLILFPMQYMFGFLGMIMLIGTIATLTTEDTV